jgi:septal ring factor EnvC (AmiA/AmiB activator)
MRWMVLVLIAVLGACATQPMERARRWPNHRKETDARFAELERRATDLEKKNSELEASLVDLAKRLRALDDAKVTAPPMSGGGAPTP